ncbi:alpha/beta-hydrolase [Gigaspora margarita]|uniref:Alpha/beta-hydrolase n=1 Tax=Gigaspora margarita TaxID=4874 RepID=A0A8H4ARE8_GIGMA|nr:alpha/beta-hydrolase [Gigaspora margarita]
MSQSSFSPQYYELLEQIQKSRVYFKDMSIDEVKKQMDSNLAPIPDNIIINEVKLDEKYRMKSKEYLVDGLKIYEDVIDEKWKDFDDGGLCGEWVKVKDMKHTGRVVLYMFGGGYYMGSAKSSRHLTQKIAENAQCSVFAINYRLSPQYQFPAPLCDALAAYLYLTDPGPDAGFKPINPKKIIFAGSSAGGGLAIATALFIRDVGLPLPAGLVLWSPWVDLTSSMASFVKPEMDKTDFVSGELNSRKLGSPSPMTNEYLNRVKILSEKIKQKKPNVVSHPSFTKIPRFRLYCANEALAIPYVSPMLAESLGNLPPILCQVGSGERFLDSNILFSFKASDPSKFQLPKYATMNFANSPFKKPTKVTLEVYEEACHCFQSLPIDEKISQFSIKSSCEFIKNIFNENTLDKADGRFIDTIIINPNCEVRELDTKFLECLSWENIGVVPDLEVEIDQVE